MSKPLEHGEDWSRRGLGPTIVHVSENVAEVTFFDLSNAKLNTLIEVSKIYVSPWSEAKFLLNPKCHKGNCT